MKKLSIFLIAILFNIAVMAQSTTNSVSNQQPSSLTKSADHKSLKTSVPASKSDLKKTGVNKKPIHHVTAVKKAGSADESKSHQVDTLKR